MIPHIKTLLILFVLFLQQGLHAQTFFEKMKLEFDTLLIEHLVKKGNKHFEGLAYIKAQEKYEKLLKMDFSPDSVKRNLAISYLKLGETLDAEDLFTEIITSGNYIPQDMYYYAQALKYNKKYEEADIWIDKYKSEQDKDRRADLQHNAAPVIKEIYEKTKYEIEPAWFNSKYSDFGAVIFNDEIYFASGRNDQAIIQYEYSWNETPYLDIYKTSIDKPVIYSEPRIVLKGINSRFHDGPLCYNQANDEMFVTRSNFFHGMPKYSEKKENHFKLYWSRLIDNEWSELEELPFNDNSYSCGHPSISSDNQTLFFASDMPGGYGESDIYYVMRNGDSWSEPVNMGPEINTEGDEMFPFISNTGILYFASNGHLGLGGLDIYLAKQNADKKYDIYNMGYPLNSNNDDFSFYLEENDVNGYFASNRAEGVGDDDIYKFTFIEKPSFEIELIGVVKDKNTGEILKNSNVAINDIDGNNIFSGKTNNNGKIFTTVNSGSKYSLTANKEKYHNNSLNFLATPNNDKKVEVEILLDLIYEWGVFGFIYEKESGLGVDSVNIIITAKNGNVEIYDTTDNNGNFKKLLEPDTDYDILLKKKKFFTRRGEFTTKNMEPGWIDVREFIEVEMEEIVVGKTIEIPNIYYDLAKWNIRSDAAIELDKVVQFLLDNETITIELGSHTDSRGSNTSNETLSQKRAESAVNYIVEHGIDRSRITAKGYGESKLKNGCADGIKCSEEEHQENRRTEIMIVDF